MSVTTHSVGEVATALGCTPRWLVEQARHGRIPARRIAKQWRFTDSDVRDILALCANGFQSPAATSVAPATGLTQQSRLRLAASNELPVVSSRGPRKSEANQIERNRTQ